MSKSLIILENINQLDELNKLNKLIILDFYADWCGPCNRLNPFLNMLINKKEYQNYVEIVKINIDKFQQLNFKYKIKSIPHFVFLFKNEILETFTGSNEDKIIEKINNQLGIKK